MASSKLNTGSSDWVQNDGSTAITDTSTKVIGGAAAGLSADTTRLDRAPIAVTSDPDWKAEVTSVTVEASGGKALYTKSGHTLVVGDTIKVTDTNSVLSGVQYVTAKTDTTFTTNRAYTSGAGTLSYQQAKPGYNYQSETEFLIRTVCNEVGGVSNTTLQSGGSDFGLRDAIHYRRYLKTVKYATAVRAGYWNEYAGTWSSSPATADDTETAGVGDSGLNDDVAANPTRSAPGRITYSLGAYRTTTSYSAHNT